MSIEAELKALTGTEWEQNRNVHAVYHSGLHTATLVYGNMRSVRLVEYIGEAINVAESIDKTFALAYPRALKMLEAGR